MAKKNFVLEFSTSYGQFYLNDKDYTGDTSSESFWSQQAFDDKLALENGILGVSLQNDVGIVKCELDILDSKSLFDFPKCDHVVEAGLEIRSGIIQVTDCPSLDVILEIPISNGDYRVRVYFFNIGSGYDENPQDYYKIEIWKEAFSDRTVLKNYQE
ncbi:hypothetical protein [Flavobacterium mesophilum]|uniref:hypothetical protein n=1 Tax=Flavobacterium mesophilum TaxID=3143495 RepID=UPI0031D72782